MKNTLVLLSIISLLAACSSEPKPEQKPVPPEVMNKENTSAIPASILASAKDPVCGMSIESGAADSTTYKGKVYGFCNTGCKDAFKENPGEYIKE
jgi:YHS domain-containing protein